MTQISPILVIGGTGKTGRRVVERLHARSLPVRIGSRAGSPPFDWKDRVTWAAALQGIDAAYITYQPDLAVPGAADDIRAFTAQAVTAGVRRLVLLSGRGEEEAQYCEQIVQQAGAEWTIVRASWFNQNFDESFFLDPILSGVIALPVAEVREPFVDADDIADVVVAALTEDRHAGQVYELSGPRLMTFRDVVAEIASATGRDLQFVQITPEQYTASMHAAGVPGDYIWLVNYLFTNVLDGRNSSLTDGVQRALGRAPRDFSDYARATAARGVWNSAAVERA
ncbi:MAG: NAD(P)H-binding protein [Chloroflexota bacterium]|nr:NAD(P)H-binding protein [Chloroflexota bacterium]